MNKLQKNHSSNKSLFIRGLSLKTLSIMLLVLVSTTSNANEFDQRQALPLNQKQQAHVLTEMRSLLAGTQAIIAALETDDMEAVAKHARPLGMGMKKKPENKLHNVLPKAFMMLGKSVHRDFDSIADDAELVKDSKHTLLQLSETLKTCQGCHESYRIEVSNASEAGYKQGMGPGLGDGSGSMKRERSRMNLEENK